MDRPDRLPSARSPARPLVSCSVCRSRGRAFIGCGGGGGVSNRCLTRANVATRPTFRTGKYAGYSNRSLSLSVSVGTSTYRKPLADTRRIRGCAYTYFISDQLSADCHRVPISTGVAHSYDFNQEVDFAFCGFEFRQLCRRLIIECNKLNTRPFIK